jgi:hypothetical protein
MSNDVKPLTYTLDEARHRLRQPPPSRSSMYELIKSGLLKVSGYYGDRPFFVDEDLQACTEQLRQRQQERQTKPPRRRLARGGAR